MELIFIRHGEGEHTLNNPDSLHLPDPSLTERGKQQAVSLSSSFMLTSQDIVIVSPVRRTLETAQYWINEIECRKIIHPLVGPRLFPIKNSGKTLPCDVVLPIEKLEKDFPAFEIENTVNGFIWTEGINLISDIEFIDLAKKFIDWCKSLNRDRIFVVSHDGTITTYRQHITGTKLSREDFPKETDWYILEVQ